MKRTKLFPFMVASVLLSIILIIATIYCINSKNSSDDIVYKYLHNLNENYQIRDTEVYENYQLITFTGPKNVLGCLLVESNRKKSNIVKCGYGENVDYVLLHYNTGNEQFACLANTGRVKKVIVNCDQEVEEYFELNKNGISSNILKFKANGERWGYVLLDENDKVIE